MGVEAEPAARDLAHERERASAETFLEPVSRELAAQHERVLGERSVGLRLPLPSLREDARDEPVSAVLRAPLRPEHRAERAPDLAIAGLVAGDDSLRIGAEPRTRDGQRATHRGVSRRAAASADSRAA